MVERISLSSGRDRVLADNHDAVTIEADVTDTQGRPVPDGTQVQFFTTAGVLEPTLSETTNGRATTTLRSGTSPGGVTASVTALVEGRLSESSLDILIMREAFALDEGSKIIQISARTYLGFYESTGLIVGTGEVEFEYRRLRIHADSLQYLVWNSLLKAESALITNGDREYQAEEVYIDFSQPLTRGVMLLLEPTPHTLFFVGDDFRETEWPAPENKFRPWPILDSDIVIACSDLMIFPREKIVLKHAKIYYDDMHILTLPVHVIALSSAAVSSIPQLIGFNSSGGLVLDYPYYFTVKADRMGALHLRRGSLIGTQSGREGFYVDSVVEFSNQREGEGSFVVDGIFTSTYGARLQYSQPLDERTNASFYLGWPSHRYLFGNAYIYRSGRNVDQTINGNYFSGSGFQSTFSLDSSWNYRPKKILADNLSVGYSLDLGVGRDYFDPRSFAEWGGRIRAQPAKSLRLGNFCIGPRFTAGVLSNTLGRTETVARTAVEGRFNFSRSSSLAVGYNVEDRRGSYFRNGVSHQLTAQVNLMPSQRWYSFISATRDIDRDNLFAYGMASYSISENWKINTNAIYQSFGPYSFQDVTVSLARLIGGQELRLTYSSSRDRLYLELTRAGGFLGF